LYNSELESTTRFGRDRDTWIPKIKCSIVCKTTTASDDDDDDDDGDDIHLLLLDIQVGTPFLFMCRVSLT